MAKKRTNPPEGGWQPGLEKVPVKVYKATHAILRQLAIIHGETMMRVIHRLALSEFKRSREKLLEQIDAISDTELPDGEPDDDDE